MCRSVANTHVCCSSQNLPNHVLAASTDPGRETIHALSDYRFESGPQDTPEEQEPPASNADTSVDRDDELLNLSPPTQNFALLDLSLQHRLISLTARLHGMFSKADPPSTPGLYSKGTPAELTCYRRNLFQVTGSITIPRTLRSILMNDGNQIPIMAYELCVLATESVEGHSVKLISVPWKTPANGVPNPEDKTEKEPTSIPLDLMSSHDIDADTATIPFAWKRLQFRVATANNGRRKELQQHFTVRLRLVATLVNGNKANIAETRSVAIVVRGRSPRNFQQRKDLALGDKASSRRGSGSPAVLPRRAATDPESARSPLKRERSDEKPFPSLLSSGDDVQAMNFNTIGSGFTKPSHGSSSAPAYPTPTFRTPTLPSSKSTSSASPPVAQQQFPHPNDSHHSRSPPDERPAKLPRKVSSSDIHSHPYNPPSLPSPRTMLSGNSGQPFQQPPSYKLETTTTDSTTPVYQYHPLTFDDWQRPFESVYRPPTVSHISMGAVSAAASMQPSFTSIPTSMSADFRNPPPVSMCYDTPSLRQRAM